MALPNKLQLPDLYIEEMQKYIQISNNPNRTNTGQASYTNPRTLQSYTTTGSAYDGQGEQGLGLLLYNVSPKLSDYIFDIDTYIAIQNRITFGTTNIPTTGWVANVGDNALKLDLAITGVLSTHWVDVEIDKDYQDIASDAEINPTVEEYAGGITFYANKAPSVAIPIRYKVVK